jgi:peptide/nickel transport system ATP-binding protein/oligopeptide transport system ATP-binding protein
VRSLISLQGLSIKTSSDGRSLTSDVNISLIEGEALGIVGESGSGKTLTALSILGLLPRGVEVASGEINFNGENLLSIDPERLRGIRGKEISMVYQDPMTALNPVMTVGNQLLEVLDCHNHDVKDPESHVKQSLIEVGIPDPDRALKSYPHEFSGGMRQRVVIAMSLLLSPKLLIADEPTTALDVTIQRQILSLVSKQRSRRQMSMLWITHDLGVVANLVDRVAVMYAGRIVEVGTTKQIFNSPQHPYTQGLLASLPVASSHTRNRLASIPGVPPKPWLVGQSCSFADRCQFAQKRCQESLPLLDIRGTKSVACFYPIASSI